MSEMKPRKRDYGPIIGDEFRFGENRRMVKRRKMNDHRDIMAWFPAPTSEELIFFEDGDGATVSDALVWLSKLPRSIATTCMLNVEGLEEIHAPDYSNPVEIMEYLNKHDRDAKVKGCIETMDSLEEYWEDRQEVRRLKEDSSDERSRMGLSHRHCNAYKVGLQHGRKGFGANPFTTLYHDEEAKLYKEGAMHGLRENGGIKKYPCVFQEFLEKIIEASSDCPGIEWDLRDLDGMDRTLKSFKKAGAMRS